MPKRFFADTIISKLKMVNVSLIRYGIRYANITLVNQLGDTVSLDDIKGSIIIANYFFTRCPSICPTLTKNMKALQDAMKMKDLRKKIDSSFVRFISFSVDPKRDSARVLKKYADKYGINHDTWWMLTGPKKTIYDYAFNELKLGLQDGEGIDTNFIHTEKFVLIDKSRIVRGYYNGLDSAIYVETCRRYYFINARKRQKEKTKTVLVMLEPMLVKNDKRARIVIFALSIIVFLAVVVLSRVQVPIGGDFDVHIFAKINAVINSIVSVLLVAGLITVKNRRNYKLHKNIMLAAMVLSAVISCFLYRPSFAGR